MSVWEKLGLRNTESIGVARLPRTDWVPGKTSCVAVSSVVDVASIFMEVPLMVCVGCLNAYRFEYEGSDIFSHANEGLSSELDIGYMNTVPGIIAVFTGTDKFFKDEDGMACLSFKSANSAKFCWQNSACVAQGTPCVIFTGTMWVVLGGCIVWMFGRECKNERVSFANNDDGTVNGVEDRNDVDKGGMWDGGSDVDVVVANETESYLREKLFGFERDISLDLLGGITCCAACMAFSPIR